MPMNPKLIHKYDGYEYEIVEFRKLKAGDLIICPTGEVRQVGSQFNLSCPFLYPIVVKCDCLKDVWPEWLKADGAYVLPDKIGLRFVVSIDDTWKDAGFMSVAAVNTLGLDPLVTMLKAHGHLSNDKFARNPWRLN